jgi:1,4-dihydroxy-2-naphthoyl-CoA hydrolase
MNFYLENSMSIWRTPIDLQSIIESCKNTLVEFIGIEFTEIGDHFLKGRMPVDHRTLQPHGIMHGGASCVLAETLASIAANYCVDQSKEFCVGLDINTSHIRMIKSGFVYGSATPIHLGKSTQLWEVRIVNDQDQLISTTKLTLFVLQHRH